MPQPTHHQIDALFEAFTRPGSPGCALGVMRDGQLVYKRGYGLANLEYDIPITLDTVFPVASMSKQFTAMAVALLAGSGRLSLDDDIRAYLPQVPDFGQTITVRHLIHHTSGLRSDPMLLFLAGWRLEDAITNGDMMDLIARQRELNFTPGEQYAYGGAGYVLLAALVERVSGASLAQFCRERIFEPLGMTSTHFHDDYLKLVKNRAYAYYAVGDNEYKNAVLTMSLVGGTGLYTSVEDLARWDANFYTGQVGGPTVIQQLHQRGVLNDGEEIAYAFGHSWSRYKGLDVVEHAGGGPGIRCHMQRFPEARFSVAVLGNAGTVDAVGLARQVADLYLIDIIQVEDEPADSAPPKKVDSSVAGAQPVTPGDLGAYAGCYYSPELDVTWTIVLDGDRLVVHRRRQGSSLLTPAGADLFSDEWEGLIHQATIHLNLAFERDEHRLVFGFRVSDAGGGVCHLLFAKQDP